MIIKIIQVIYQIVVMNKIPKITWDLHIYLNIHVSKYANQLIKDLSDQELNPITEVKHECYH